MGHLYFPSTPRVIASGSFSYSSVEILLRLSVSSINLILEFSMIFGDLYLSNRKLLWLSELEQNEI
jgi:hypothetical protein